ncbi:MAG TPA: rhodanese-like domain-containing protein [bacterium]|nr:MAG: molybdopterin biosynthesis protein MoeB [Parcubacteria group bacterium ADurb.Bin192]HPN15416.1 rhodanese-like domain-containing protein [bacterium]
MSKFLLISCFSFLGLLTARQALAVPPPDFIFNAGSSIVQVFSLVFLFLSAAFGTLYQYAKVRIASKGAKVVVVLIMLYLIVFVSVLGAHLYSSYAQRRAYLDWLEVSREQTKQALEAVGATSTEKELQPLYLDNGWIDNDLDQVRTASTTVSSTEVMIIKNKVKITNSSPTTTNADFLAALASKTQDFVVLDAREDVEYEIGHLPGSLHIRAADLKAGSWSELPLDKTVYVLCWSGLRGLDVAEFLRSKNIVAVALEDGAESWVADGGQWQGGILFSKAFPEERYAKLYTTEEVEDLRRQGVVLVDSREPYKYDQWHISNTINIPLIYTASPDLEESFDHVPAGSKVITVCDAYVNCFDAKLTGIELEKRGYEFLGRYNTPWELK